MAYAVWSKLQLYTCVTQPSIATYFSGCQKVPYCSNTSMPVECMCIYFQSQTNIVTRLRSCLSPEHVNMLVLLNKK